MPLKAKDIFKEINIPKGRIIVVHARLSNLKELMKVDYTEAARAIIDSIYELYQPKTILVPTFTYSFTKSGIYHRLFSKSEVGRFSEEVRNIYSQYRTPDPIFSFVDTNNIIHKNNIDYRTAFDKGSLFEFLDKEDCIVLNADLDTITQTQIHYVEKVNQVDYRYEKVFTGVVYHDQSRWEYINYKYYVRDLLLDPKMDYKKREQYLIESGDLQIFYNNDLKISWISAKTLKDAITKALKEDPHFLIIKQDG